MNFLTIATLALVSVQALQLPPHTTVRPTFTRFTAYDRNPVATGGNTIAADITNGDRPGLAVWRDGVRISLPAIWSRNPQPLSLWMQLGAVAPNGAIYAMRAEGFSGAYSGTWYDVFRLMPTTWRQINTKGCVADYGVAHVERVETDGTLDLTFESPELINFDVVPSGAYAPYAAIYRNSSCKILGRFNLRDSNARFAVGFRGYLGSTLAPTNVNLAEQHFVAIRRYNNYVQEIGPGEAFSVTTDGIAVGSDAPPIAMSYSEGDSRGTRAYSCCTPHAMLWGGNQRAKRLAPQAPESVAYQIDRRHRVIGTLLGRDGRHYAFLWQNGHLQLLDEIAHVPGWRFEAAYRFLPNGSIVGAGTYRGIATVFVMSLRRT